MNENEAEKYFSLRLKQLKYVGDLEPGEVTDLVKEAIKNGKADFWHKRQWTFRRRAYNLSITSEADAYELPDDACAVMVNRENDSLYGFGLVYVSKDEFDRRIPYPAAHSGDTPMLCTVYRDKDKMYISFWPRPSSTTIYMSYLLDTPENLNNIPDVARAATYASIAKYLYPIGTPEHAIAMETADREIKALEIQDTPYAEDQWKFFDDTDVRVEYTRPWI